MILKILLYPVAYVIYYMMTYLLFVRFNIVLLVIKATAFPEPLGRTPIFFLMMVLHTFGKFVGVLGGAIILKLWGHQFSWIIFIFFLVILDFLTFWLWHGVWGSLQAKLAGLLGGLVGLALVSLLVSCLR